MRFGGVAAAAVFVVAAPASAATIQGAYTEGSNTVILPSSYRPGDISLTFATSGSITDVVLSYQLFDWERLPGGGYSDQEFLIERKLTGDTLFRYAAGFFGPIPDHYVPGRYADAPVIHFTSASAGTYLASVTGGAYVPEPATWTLMILGFGAAAGAMRRKNVRAPVAASS